MWRDPPKYLNPASHSNVILAGVVKALVKNEDWTFEHVSM
jgi:hypothetical protein